MRERYPNFRRAQRTPGPYRVVHPLPPSRTGSRATFALQLIAAMLVTGTVVWHATPTPRGDVAAPATVTPRELPVHFPSCKVARAAGAAPILRGAPGYRLELDRDGDGIACEPEPGT